MHISKKLFFVWIWIALSGVSFGSGEQEQKEPPLLHIYNWADYLPFSVVEKFEKETGIKVHYDVFEGSEILEAKLLAASSGYDVVFPSAWPETARLIPVGLFLPLDLSQIPHAKGLDPVLKKKLAKADPGNQYILPFLWGTTGFAYNVAAVQKIFSEAPVNSLRLLFDPEILKKFSSCHVTLLDTPTEVFEMALLYLGCDPASERQEDLEKAVALLLQIRPYITKFDSSQFVGPLVNGENCISQTWSSYGNMAHKRGLEAKNPQNIVYVIPEEGSFLWIDVMAIPKDARHPQNAHAFINFILRPDIMAEITNYTRTANAVPASNPFIEKEILQAPGIYPARTIVSKLIVTGPKPPQYARLLLRAWTKIKTGR